MTAVTLTSGPRAPARSDTERAPPELVPVPLHTKELALARDTPDWVITEDFDDVDLGVIATGKEGEVGLVERVAHDGTRSHLLARKRYRPRSVKKGELQALGFERAPTFRNDIMYRDGRNYGKRSRDRRAVETMTNYGKELVKQKWLGHEFEVMRAAWERGASVPYPIGYADDGGLLLEYIGDGRAGRATAGAGAAVEARAGGRVGAVARQRATGDRGGVRARRSVGVQHAVVERSALADRLPASGRPRAEPHGFELLHRDALNVCRWFASKGVEADGEALFAELLAAAF